MFSQRDINIFKLYNVDPMSADWHFRYPHIRVFGLFVRSKLIVKLIYLLKGYDSFSKEMGILTYRYWI